MAKAVLVIDMSELCSKCKFMYEIQGIKKCQLMSQLMNVLNGGTSRLSQNSFTEKRHEKCPLRELPEQEHNDNEYDEYSDGWDAEWNACLDKITSI